MLKCNTPRDQTMATTVFIHSHIQSVEGIQSNVIIENTKLNYANRIGKNCIISNNIFPENVTVPDCSFLHTVVLRNGGDPFYVTVAFGIEDNIKKCCDSKEDMSSLCYAGVSLDKMVDKMEYSHVSIDLT